jgi:hypothetical protein
MNRLIKILNKILAISNQVCITMTIVHDQIRLFKKHGDILIYRIKRLKESPYHQLKNSHKRRVKKNIISILVLKEKKKKSSGNWDPKAKSDIAYHLNILNSEPIQPLC